MIMCARLCVDDLCHGNQDDTLCGGCYCPDCYQLTSEPEYCDNCRPDEDDPDQCMTGPCFHGEHGLCPDVDANCCDCACHRGNLVGGQR